MAIGDKYRPGYVLKTWRETNKTELPEWATNVRKASNMAKAYCYIKDNYKSHDTTKAFSR